MHHQHVVLLGQGDHPFEEVQFHTLRGRVGREAEDHHLRLGDRAANRALQLSEEIHARYQRHRTYLGAGNHCAVDMNRVAGVGHQHGIALVQGGQHQVRQAFLGTDGHDSFGLRVDFHRVTVLVPTRNRPAQARNAFGGGVAVGVFTLGDGDHFLHDMRRRGAVRITHAQVDDVFAAPTRSHLQLGSDIENIRGESIYARKAARRTLVCHCCLEVRKRPEPSERRRPLRWPAGQTIRAMMASCPDA